MAELHKWASGEIITKELMNAINDAIESKSDMFHATANINQVIDLFAVLPLGIPANGMYLQQKVDEVNYTYFQPFDTNQLRRISDKKIPVKDDKGNLINGQFVNDTWTRLYGQLNI